MKYNTARFKIFRKDGGAMDAGTMQDARDIVAALAGEAGFESFENTDEGTDGYMQAAKTDMDAIDAALRMFPLEGIGVTYTMEEAEDKDWNSLWESSGFAPISIGGRCVIHDTMHTDGTVADGTMDITIDTRQAFGTGTHETTRMIVAQLLDMDVRGKDVLDCGCGTGILSIVASKCGARSVTGYDIDEWSVRNTEHNARINMAENIRAVHGDAGAMAGMDCCFDIILANINRNILLEDMPAMRSKMREGSVLILSGFYENDEQMLKDRAGQLGLKPVRTERTNGWSMLVFSS